MPSDKLEIESPEADVNDVTGGSKGGRSFLGRVGRQLHVAYLQSSYHFLNTPLVENTAKAQKRLLGSSHSDANQGAESRSLRDLLSVFSFHFLHTWIFGNIPGYYTLDKKLTILKQNTFGGKLWDGLLVLLSLLACGMYVAETYNSSFHAVRVYFNAEIIVTNFFAFDFVYCFFANADKIKYLFNPWTAIDLLTIIPVYITIAFSGKKKSPNLSIFRFVRILRLVRILRTFKLLGNMSGVKRQIVTLSLTLTCLVFMAAGIVQIFENDLKQQMELDCNFINEFTDWEPSCSAKHPFIDGCDCHKYFCEPFYNRYDREGEPSGVNCNMLTFLDAFYYMVVTISSVGYGDISPSTTPTKAVVVVFIITSFVIIPQQLNEVTRLIALSSIYRQPYIGKDGDSEVVHVVIVGHVVDHIKIDEFLKEFFNPNHLSADKIEYDVVILSPGEPSDNLKAVINSPLYDGRVFYIIGSALSAEDLVKAGANTAYAMFFLCNSEANEEFGKLDDAATVLRTLNVRDFNPQLKLFAQVLRSEDREILKGTDIDVILCLDEYRTALQAKNSICPGISTLVENLFHTFGGWDEEVSESMPDESVSRPPWERRYLDGADKELYYINLDKKLLETLKFEWPLLQEAIFLQYGVVALGVVCPDDLTVVLNPTKFEIHPFRFAERFFYKHRLVVILADDQTIATQIEIEMSDSNFVNRVVERLIEAEETFGVRLKNRLPRQSINMNNSLFYSGSSDNASLEENLNSQFVPHATTNASAVSLLGDEFDCATLDDSISADGSRPSDVSISPSKRRASRKIKGNGSPAASKETNGMNKLSAFRQIMIETKSRSSTIDITMQQLFHVDESEDVDDDNSTMHDLQELRMRKHKSVSNKMLSPMSDLHSSDSEILTLSKDSISPVNDTIGGNKYRDAEFSYEILTPKTVTNTAFDGVQEFELTSSSFEDQLKMLFGVADYDAGDQDELEDANDLTNHVIVFGSLKTLPIFVAELRRPLVVGSAYHPILVMGSEKPAYWDSMAEAYTDIHYMRGSLTTSSDFNRVNVREAFSLVLLADPDNLSKVEEDNLDSFILFSYLKLEKFIPRSVFFTCELSCVSNIAVMNSSILRRLFPAVVAESNQKAAKAAGIKIDKVDLSDKIGPMYSSKIPSHLSSPSNSGSDSNPARQRLSSSDHNRQTFASQRKRLPALNNDIRSMSRPKGDDADVKEGTDGEKYMVSSKLSTKVDKNSPRDDTPIEILKQRPVDSDDLSSGATTHHTLPVFASGRAFVPHSFDSLLCQCFYSLFAPQVCEKLICGQKYQTLYQIPCPAPFVGRKFVDLFRAFSSRQFTIIAIYVAANFDEECSVLPFVETCPAPDTILREYDRLFVFCNPVELHKALENSLNRGFIVSSDGKCSMNEVKPEVSIGIESSGSNRLSAKRVGKAAVAEEKGEREIKVVLPTQVASTAKKMSIQPF